MVWFKASDDCLYDRTGEDTVMLMRLMMDYPTTLILDTVSDDDGTPYKITLINDGVLFESQIQNLTLTNIINIPGGTFSGNTALQYISLPSITDLPPGIFSGCTSLSEVHIPNLLAVPDDAFNYCTALTSVSFPKATTVGRSSFYVCMSLSSISLEKVTTVGDSSFDRCISLSVVSLPNATTIGMQSFYRCHSLSSVSLPNVTNINILAFASDWGASNQLHTVNGTETTNNIHIPKIQTIGFGAFVFNTVISAYFPPSIIEIGHAAFLKLESTPMDVFFYGKIPDIAIGMKNQGIIFPDGCCFYRIDPTNGLFFNDIATIHYSHTYQNSRIGILAKTSIQMNRPTIGSISAVSHFPNTMYSGSGTIRNYRVKYKR